MADANQEFPTILGPDASFKGELSFDKGMRLQGKFEGEVEGNLSASDRIELKASTRYKGDLTAAKLVVEEGAAFIGHVSVGPDNVKGKPGGGMPRPNMQGQPQQGQNK